MKKLPAFVIVVVAGCMQQNPPPQYPQYQQQSAQPPMQPQPAAVAAEPTPAQPVAPAEPMRPPEEPLPIDPDGEMPTDGLSTNAKLELGKEAIVKVDARSDIYSSGAAKADGSRGGVMPAELTLAAGAGIVSFPKLIGKASCVAGAGTDADGGSCAGGDTDLKSAGKLSGIKHHQRTMFLVGVFVGAKLPAKAPPALDFSDGATGTTFARLEPALGQVFWIGDGKPGQPLGDTHDFVVPKGATRLFLGYADGFSFQGSPGAYGDNKGGLEVTVLQRK